MKSDIARLDPLIIGEEIWKHKILSINLLGEMNISR